METKSEMEQSDGVMPDQVLRAAAKSYVDIERQAVVTKSKQRLRVYVAVGALTGVGYGIADYILDSLETHGGLVGMLYAAHEVVDHVLPVMAGALLGFALHYVKSRTDMAREAARKESDLRVRLMKVERNQAAWVVAAATLHEVRNPLHAIGLLLDEIVSVQNDESERAALVERARGQMDRIGEHLGKLRTLTARGQPEMRVVDLPRLVSDVAIDHVKAGGAEHVDVRIEADQNVRAEGDPTYVRIILDNIIGNGLEALRERGGGKLTIAVACPNGRDAVVRVSDDGHGIDPEIGESGIFEPLRTTKEQGLGLGLSIGRALARAMRGDLTLETREGPGTTLCLRLPVPSGGSATTSNRPPEAA
jgi:signal transduction histidine kinase